MPQKPKPNRRMPGQKLSKNLAAGPKRSMQAVNPPKPSKVSGPQAPKTKMTPGLQMQSATGNSRGEPLPRADMPPPPRVDEPGGPMRNKPRPTTLPIEPPSRGVPDRVGVGQKAKVGAGAKKKMPAAFGKKANDMKVQFGKGKPPGMPTNDARGKKAMRGKKPAFLFGKK